MPIEVNEIAVRWIDLARIELSRADSGYLNPTHCAIPEIHEVANALALAWVGTIGGAPANCDSVDDTVDALIADGSFEARWALLYFVERVIAIRRALVACLRFGLDTFKQVVTLRECQLLEEVSRLPFEELRVKLQVPITTLKELMLAIAFCCLAGKPQDVPPMIKEAIRVGVTDPTALQVVLAQHCFVWAFSDALRRNFMRLRVAVEATDQGLPAPTTSIPELCCVGDVESLSWQGHGVWTMVELPHMYRFSLTPDMISADVAVEPELVASALADRHRGSGCPLTPATPPCERVRTRRFEKLRHHSMTNEGSPSDLK